jgi:radical SAM protein with 4Fe4S-binding SPASM domain
MVLRFNIVIHRENIRELPRYLSMAKALGVEEIALFHMIVHDMRLFDLSLFNFQEQANRSLDESREIARDLGITLIAPENFPKDGSSLKREKSNVPYRQKCFQPWKEILIGHDGTISPCCSWGDDAHGFLGKGFENAWNDQLFRSLRQELSSGKLRQVCRICSVLTGGTVQNRNNFISRFARDLEKKS